MNEGKGGSQIVIWAGAGKKRIPESKKPDGYTKKKAKVWNAGYRRKNKGRGKARLGYLKSSEIFET